METDALRLVQATLLQQKVQGMPITSFCQFNLPLA